MADETTTRSTPPQPEVEGHGFKIPAKPETDQAPETEGHGWRLPATPETNQEADVEGHLVASKRAKPDTGQEAEVEGHLNPVLAQDMASAHQRTLHAQADRDRRARTAVDGTDRDAGMLAKIKKFAGREG